MPIKAAEEQRMQLTRRSRVLRSSKNMPRFVGIFAGDVSKRDAREPGCEFLRQDGGHSLSLLSVCKRMSRLAVRCQLATLSFPFRAKGSQSVRDMSYSLPNFWAVSPGKSRLR